MGDGAIGAGGPVLRHPFLQALLAAEVPVDQVIAQAEILGFPPEDLLGLAQALVPSGRGGGAMAPLLLVLGAAARWQPYVARALAYGIRFFEPLVRPCCSEFDSLARLLDEEAWDKLCRTALERLGHPADTWLQAAGAAAAATVLPWLDKDLGLVLDGLELSGFASRAGTWSQVLADTMIFRDGAGPRALSLAPGDPLLLTASDRSLRLHRVSRLRSLEGLETICAVVAVDCPDLERLDFTPPVAVLKGLPGLRQVRSNPQSRLLHLEDCPRLRSIGAAKVWDLCTGDKVTPSHQSLILSRCAALRDLPAGLEVAGHMVLEGMGPIHQWPVSFRVGGDLRIKDCPHIEELPALEVRGCLRVEGASGLRRMAPGTVIGGHLDLRACGQLEGVPRGVKVGGALYLPAHLHRPGPAFEPPEPLLDLPGDRYPVLRELLLGLSFPGLSSPAERNARRDRAEQALESLRRELRDHPRFEAELLWTASEVWRDLSEELWAEEHPMYGSNQADDDLPLAWFRGLLLSA